MMISPENYYCNNLQGKNAAEIAEVISDLKQKMTQLKNTLEHPDYKCRKRPGELTQLSCMEEYLERAKTALVEVGGTYQPSPEEYAIANFNKQLENVSKVTFRIGAYLGGWCDRTVTIGKGTIHLQSVFFPEVEKNGDASYPFDVQDIVAGLQKLNLGGWRDYYDTERFGIIVLDGTGWHLDIEFSGGLPARHFSGDNAYPYNFQKLQAFFDELWEGCP